MFVTNVPWLARAVESEVGDHDAVAVYRRLKASQPRLTNIPTPATTTIVAASTVAKTRENQRSLIPNGKVIRKQVPQMIASTLATFAIRFTSAHYGVGNSSRGHSASHGAASASVGVIREARTAG
jgi:hypothetical protein